MSWEKFRRYFRFPPPFPFIQFILKMFRLLLLLIKAERWDEWLILGFFFRSINLISLACKNFFFIDFIKVHFIYFPSLSPYFFYCLRNKNFQVLSIFSFHFTRKVGSQSFFVRWDTVRRVNSSVVQRKCRKIPRKI